jgi:hypothetical protein
MEDWEESDNEEWVGGGGERSVTLAGRLERRPLAGLVGPEEQVVTQEGEVQGGEQLPKLLSALKQAWREEEKREWEVLWRRALVGAGLRSVDPRPPGPSFTKHLHSLSCRNATLLSQLHLNFDDLGPTKPFLDSASPEQLCECVSAETRKHFLLECRRYDGARGELRRELKGVPLSTWVIFLLSFPLSFVSCTPPSVFPFSSVFPIVPHTPRFLILSFSVFFPRHRSFRRSDTELFLGN